MRKHDATYFGYSQKGGKFARIASLVLLLGWLAILQGSGQAQTQQQNYNAVSGVTTGAGVAMGVGGVFCAAVTAGGCVPIAIAGGILAGAGGTMGAMNQATGASSHHTGPLPGDMPDYGDNDFSGHGSGMGSGGGGGMGISPSDEESWWESLLDAF